jgi:hypothetical protein
MPDKLARSTAFRRVFTRPRAKADSIQTSFFSLLMSSRAEEFHLRALPEPYVNLSIHTAPDVRPLP